MEGVSEPGAVAPRSGRVDAFVALVPLFAFFVAVAIFAILPAYRLEDFPLDDAWIHQVYARSLSSGHGFAYNGATQEAGFTSPLWIVVTAPAHWLRPFGGLSAVAAGVKGVGVLLGGLSVLFAYSIARSLTGSRWAAAVAAILFGIDPRLTFSSLSGMETVLLVALWLGVVWATLARRFTLAVVCCGLMPVARPESVVLVPLVLAGIAVAGDGCDGVWRRPSTWAVLGAPALAWSGFCLAVTGRFLPNTFYLKAAPFAVGPAMAGVAWRNLIQHGWGCQPLLWLAIAALAVRLAVRGGRRSLFLGAVLLLAPVLYLFAVLSSRAFSLEGYYWTRWVDPAVIILTFAMALGLALLLAAGAWIPQKRAVSVVLSVAAGLGILTSLPSWAASVGERRARLASDGRTIRRTNVEPALWIRDHTAPDAVVGGMDAGALRYFGERHTVDLMGLNNAGIALGREDRRAAASKLDWIVAFPFWLDGTGQSDLFEPEMTFRMPEAEYTVCPCPEHATVVIARRRRQGARTAATPGVELESAGVRAEQPGRGGGPL